MNRLTDKVFDCMTDFCDAKDCVNYEVDGCCSFERYRRLAAYEDTGLEPEEILSAVDMAKIACALHELNAYKDLGPIDHLRTLLQAEQDGRLVVLPCREDAELERDGHTFIADHWNHSLTAFRDAPETNSGKQVALFSIVEAEEAISAKEANK